MITRPIARRFSFAAAILTLALLAAGSAFSKDTWTGVERIVAVGDVHGDYDQFFALLQAAGLVDASANWTGGNTHLVQTGDVPDRGPDSRKVMDLLMKLEKQSRKTKGFVHALIGNHEAMNVYGDLRYVHDGEYEAFRDKGSEKLRERAYKQHMEHLKSNPPPEGLPSFDDAFLRKWQDHNRLGYFEHRRNFAPSAKYGRWIAGHNAVIKINDTLFLHGGIGPKYAGVPLKELNGTIRRELMDSGEKFPAGMTVDSEGPLWYRGLAQHDEATEAAHLEAVLGGLGAKRIVMGHTVTDGTVIPRFGGRALLIDVGMAEPYGHRSACLVIEGGALSTIHRGKRLEFPTDPGQDLLRYLKEAAALDPSPSALAGKIAELEQSLTAVAGAE